MTSQWMMDAIIENTVEDCPFYDPFWDTETKVEYALERFKTFKEAAQDHSDPAMKEAYALWAKAMQKVGNELALTL